MTSTPQIVLYHWPHSRSATTLELLEELGAPYRLEVIDITQGAQNAPSFLAINPMGKLPTITVDGVVVTEQIAICIYLSDLFAEAGLTPALHDPLRGPWLRWLTYYAACFEPAMQDRAEKREPTAKMSSPYGDADLVVATVRAQLGRGPFILGDRYTTADVIWSSALGFMTMFGLIEKTPDIDAYLQRTGERPARARAAAVNARLL